MNKFTKRTMASILAVATMAGAGSVTASAASYKAWEVYQNQGAPTSDNKYTDTVSGVATGYTLSAYASSYSMSSSSNNVYVYCSKGINAYITGTSSYPSCTVKPGESFTVTMTLKINDNSYLTNKASGNVAY